MKLRQILFVLAVTVSSSMPLAAQTVSETARTVDGALYEGQWPSGHGVLYSHEDGLVLGTFAKGRPDGECICYRPNGEVYWGNFRKGKATGHGRLYRDNGVVVAGGYRQGRYHGIDTLYRPDGSVHVGRFRKGKMQEHIYEAAAVPPQMNSKPAYPGVTFDRQQDDFICELEIAWEERNLAIRRTAGLVEPKFKGGNVDDFALWVNSQIAYPLPNRASNASRTVLVQFTVQKDGSVTDVHPIFGSDPVLNEAAAKAVAKSPKWTPGEQRGEKKSVRMTVPVIFNNE